MTRFAREPLVQFLALGAALFGVFALVRGGTEDRADRIVVTPGQIEHLATGFARTWQRPPTTGELDGLIDDHVREEVYYREAMALGLDRDDTIVRRRLRQKMEFLTEDAAATAPPADEELRTYLRAHPDDFRVEPRLKFRQVYVSRDRRGDGASGDARTLLARLVAAGPDADVGEDGDPLLLPHELGLAPRSEIARLFGESFAAALERLEPGRWGGPIESGYGLHLVVVRERVEGRLPELTEVREAVEREWLAVHRKEAAEAAYRRLLERYTVTVERPAAARDEVAATR